MAEKEETVLAEESPLPGPSGRPGEGPSEDCETGLGSGVEAPERKKKIECKKCGSSYKSNGSLWKHKSQNVCKIHSHNELFCELRGYDSTTPGLNYNSFHIACNQTSSCRVPLRRSRRLSRSPRRGPLPGERRGRAGGSPPRGPSPPSQPSGRRSPRNQRGAPG